MADIYIKEAKSSPLHGTPNEVIEEGDFITTVGGGYVEVADPTEDDIDGIVPVRQRGDVIREHEEDYGPKEYDPADDDDFVPFQQLESGAELTHRALEAAAEIEMFEDVALDASLDAVPATSADAETDALGMALQHADAGEYLHARLY